jgi:glycosyltransferase involved in cell wall biosynthesis
MNISLVIPIHNEAAYLPYSLASLPSLDIKELIVIFDRCFTDASIEIFYNWIVHCREHRPLFFPVYDFYKIKQKWRCPTAELFEYGFQKARGEWLLMGAADLVYNESMFNPEFFKDVDIVNFHYLNLDLYSRYRFRQHYMNFAKKYFTFKRRRSGVMAIKRSVWEKLHFTDSPSEYDSLFDRALRKGFKGRYVFPSKPILHLRCGLSKQRQYLQGMSRASRNRNPIPTFIHSLLFAKPYLFTAYMMERRYKMFKRQQWRKNGY